MRRVFPEAFKREAVGRVATSGLSAGKVAAEVGLHETVLRRWMLLYGHGDDHRGRDDASVLADLQIGGVDPDIGPVVFDRPGQEGLDAIVDLLAQSAVLAL